MDAVSETRQKLIDGAVETIRTHGISGVSARTIATTAGVNQALVFYHFGSVHDLLSEACMVHTQATVTAYQPRLDKVTTLQELLATGRELHAGQAEIGNVKVLAQLLAGSQNDPELAKATGAALALWTTAVEQVLVRVMAGSPVKDLLDIGGLARAVSAGFVGLELFEGVDPQGARQALDTLDQLAVLVEVVDDLGPVARRAFRAKVKRVADR
ncbi:DNA-binding transcriptional regulator YbjK [Kibdelosporangium banguiense]|uniref:DNA-binding transcriptional regulator YbjK n=1 Tax=Kibdelosporangium banguiense TaxID=1365924 RepID=A0ABS4TAM4_9PSEU|nr:TetR family transcriptional regulator [Kibdelosporangium banguiense]MBP2321009.1 DNA-binding transcriptional regulator YbjK [Kibdelosporangium banguiense]